MSFPTPVATSDIVSQAFRFMKKSPISSVSDDSEEAQAAIEQYPTALEHALTGYDWSFASVLVNLSLARTDETIATDPELPYRYRLPGDVLRVREVGPPKPPRVKWRLDMHGLRADVPAPLMIRYTARDVDESQLPALFRTAVALRLAWLLGPRWMIAQSDLDTLDAHYKANITIAKTEDARSASEFRYDGLDELPDWASEATR